MVASVNVPNAPGVPPLPVGSSTAPVTLMTSDTYAYQSGLFTEGWGLFLNGALLVTADTVAAFDFKKDWAISDYPVEEGGFESYDKVEAPFDIRLRFASGGSPAKRQALLASIAAIAGTTTLYTAVTPDVTYGNVVVKHYSYTRSATNGLSLLTVEVYCQEVRPYTGSSIAAVALPGAAPTLNGGTVQPVAPTASQVAALSSGVA